jgi:hypothetical protein
LLLGIARVRLVRSAPALATADLPSPVPAFAFRLQPVTVMRRTRNVEVCKV